MPSEFYLEMFDVSVELIRESGRPISFIKLAAEPNVDPDKPWLGAGAPTVEETVEGLYGAFLYPTGSDLGRNANSAGIGLAVDDQELMKRTSQIVLVEPTVDGLEYMHQIDDPKTNTTWKIVWAQKLQPADLNVFYVFGLQR